MGFFAPILQFFAANANCASKDIFFLIPAWYKYLYAAGRIDMKENTCVLVGDFQTGDILLVGLALIDMGLRIAGIVAVAYIIWGGISYVTSQGEPDKTKQAQQTIINALIGLALSLLATGIVAFIGNQIGK